MTPITRRGGLVRREIRRPIEREKLRLRSDTTTNHLMISWLPFDSFEIAVRFHVRACTKLT